MEAKISKEEFIKNIGLGKSHHADWMAKVELVVNGIYKPEDLKPVAYNQSVYGKLFQSFSEEFDVTPSFTAIVTPLEGLYTMYNEIYKRLTSKKPMFTGQDRWTQIQIEKSFDTYFKMNDVSNTLYDSIDKFIEENKFGTTIL